MTAVDGLRAVAVGGVIGYHFGWGPQDGLLGVDLFFVISGFVITLVLLRERARTGGTNLPAFWKRRVRRIFPPVAVVLIAVAVWSWVGTVSASFRIATAQSSLFSLISGINWWEIYGGGGYWSLDAERNPLTHLWSLAIEEQFYLVYPLIFVVVVTRLQRRYRAPAVLGLAILAYSWSAAYTLWGDPTVDRIYLGTDTRSGALLIGAAVAFWISHRPGRQDDDHTGDSPAPRLSQPTMTAIGIVTFVLMMALWALSHPVLPQLSIFVLPASGFLSATLVYVMAVGQPVGLARILSLAPLVYIGRLSYSLYLWHWVVWVFLAQTVLVGRAITPWIALVVSLALSSATYHFVEQPILSRNWSWRGLLTLCAPAFILIAVSAGITLATVEPPTSQEKPSVEVTTG